MIHKRIRTAEEECALVDFIKALHYEFAAEVARPAFPTALRPGQNDYALKVGETLFQALQLRLEDDVPLSAHAVEENSVGIETKVIYVPENRDDGRNPAARGEKNNIFVVMLFETKPARWSRSFHRQAVESAVIQEGRNATLWLFLYGDFDKACLRWR